MEDEEIQNLEDAVIPLELVIDMYNVLEITEKEQ